MQVTFGEAIRLAFANFGDFSGRATRGEYWWYILFDMVIYYPLLLASESGNETMSMLLGLWVLVNFIPNLSLAVRRLHDTGRSGWNWWLWITCIGAIPLLVWLATEGDRDTNAYGPPRR